MASHKASSAGVLLASVLLAGCASHGSTAASAPARAIDAVLTSRPDLAERLRGSLPPTTLEAAPGENGDWHVAVLSWGSGRPGILSGECFSVSERGVVRQLGRFQNRETTEVRRIDLASCQAATR